MQARKVLIGLVVVSLSLLLTDTFAPAGQDKKQDQPPKKNTAAIPKASNQKRHDGFVAIAKKGDIDILFMGDSITDWWAKSGKDVFSKNFGSLKVANFGIAGDTTQGVLWRMDNGELDGYNPKLMMLMIGTNNTGSHTAEQIAEGIKACVDRFRTKHPNAKVLLLGVFPRSGGGKGGKGGLNPAPGNINKIISKYDDGKFIKYMDLTDKFVKDEAIPKDVMNDGLHPTAKGYEIWAEAVLPTIYEMIGKKK